jgi:hypothetical protein
MKQNPEQEKENQFACYCILKWGMGGFHDEYSCLAWKSTYDAQLENALAQNNNVRRIRLLRIKIVDY